MIESDSGKEELLKKTAKKTKQIVDYNSTTKEGTGSDSGTGSGRDISTSTGTDSSGGSGINSGGSTSDSLNNAMDKVD
jgi:hypothetical protein